MIVYKIKKRAKKDCNSNVLLVHDKDDTLRETDNKDYDVHKSTMCLISDTNTRFETPHVTGMITTMNGNCNNYAYGSV